MSSDLIYELGTEELPANFIVPASEALAAGFRARADAARLSFGEVKTHGTPRRLALLVKDVGARASDFEERGGGPAISAAFDADGKPTKAAEGFAKKWGVSVDALARENGRLVATRKVPGQSTLALLPELFAKLIDDVSKNRKNMRWGHETVAFPRPIRWICAVFGGEIVPVKFGDVVAGGVSFGHRFLAPQAIRLTSVDEYVTKMRDANVLVDVAERRAKVVAEIDRVAKEAGGRRVEDPDLVDTITGLVEWPSGVQGSFGADALDMPREVLISEMRGHQKYASIENDQAQLQAKFVAVANTPVKDISVSRRGYERVLRARLADARYFFDEDKTRALGDRLGDLRRVTFQEKLGSIHDKVQRMHSLARKVALSVEHPDVEHVERVVMLCKADLTTGMVGEFPDLQGVMGREYARHDGERADVAVGIFEHYLPRGANDQLPQGELGALVGISNRLDTISGIFAIGKAPTGANDPFALRRACLGVIRVVLHKGYRMSLAGLVEHALELHYERLHKLPPPPAQKDKEGKEKKAKPEYIERAQAQKEVLDFFRARLKALWSDEHGADVVEAVLATGFDDLTDAHRRLGALSSIKGRPDFLPIAVAFGRASNIIEKQAKDLVPGPVDANLFREPPERALFDATESARGIVANALKTGDYAAALKTIAELRPAVDAFFDKVLVMAEDAALKQNRLRLIREVQQLFAPIADFARIQTK